MKRTNPPTNRKPTPEDLLKKLRQVDETELKDVVGGIGRCAGGCPHRCNQNEQ
jgi:hypothetical protein